MGGRDASGNDQWYGGDTEVGAPGDNRSPEVAPHAVPRPRPRVDLSESLSPIFEAPAPEVPYGELRKGYEVAPGEYVVVRGAKFETAAAYAYDLAHKEKTRDVLSYMDATSGERCAVGSKLPLTKAGPSSRDALRLVRGLTGIDFVGFDLVEVMPQYDSGEVTSLLAGTLAHEFLALLALRRRDG
jgi:hypothetical protein